MTTFGFEFEFPGLRCKYQGNNGVIPGQFTLFSIRDANNLNVILYKINTDSLFGEWRIIEAISVFPNIGNAPPNINIFNGLTSFLNYINANIVAQLFNFAGQPLPVAPIVLPNIGGQNFVAIPEFDQTRTLVVRKMANGELSVRPQFTFGFQNNPINDITQTSTLQRFYGHFNPLDYYHPVRDLFSVNFLNNRLSPYSATSYNRFFTLFPNNNLWNERWHLIEFLRFYVACTLRNLDAVADGNKAYTPIMSRVCFKNGIFNFTLPDGDLLKNLIDYICLQYTADARNRRPFTVLYANKMIADEYGFPEIIPDINNGYNNNVNLLSLLNSIVMINGSIEERDNLRNVINDDLVLRNQLGNNLQNNNVLNPAEQVTRSLNNINNYDFLSPVPYSLNSDSFGFYSRAAIGDVLPPVHPRFLFEVRYVKRFLQEVYSINPNPANAVLPEMGNIFYNDDFRQVCACEFDLAHNEWI